VRIADLCWVLCPLYTVHRVTSYLRLLAIGLLYINLHFCSPHEHPNSTRFRQIWKYGKNSVGALSSYPPPKEIIYLFICLFFVCFLFVFSFVLLSVCFFLPPSFLPSLPPSVRSFFIHSFDHSFIYSFIYYESRTKVHTKT